MKKSKKITMLILYLLICAILLATVFFSSSLAKFISTNSSIASARVAKWGLIITSGSDLSNTYSSVDSETEVSYVTATASNNDKIIMPGTDGNLTWIQIEGVPEAAYNIDIECEETKSDGSVKNAAFSVGQGFYASQRLIRDENGFAVEYFPLVISLHVYNIDANGAKTDAVTPISFAIKKTGAEDNATVMCDNLDDLVSRVNASLDSFFDSTNNTPGTMKKIYAIEWEWEYLPASEKLDDTGTRIEKVDGVVTYQSSFLDTALCDTMYENRDNDLFKIKLDMRATVTQYNGQTETNKSNT